MTKEAVEEFLTAHGCTKDKWGHYHSKGGKRYTVSTHSVKCCVKGTDTGWIRVRSAYLRDCSLTLEGKLSGLSFYGCNSKAPIAQESVQTINERVLV
jgi:hypothetical protein